MAFALVFIGLLMIITGANNTYAAFGSQLKSDFTGQKSFVLYAAAIGGVGALGYINALRNFSHAFMALVLISIVLSNKGFFNNLLAGLNATPVSPSAGAGSAPLPSGTAASMLGNARQSPGVPGETGTYGQAKANQYFNTIKNFFGG